MKNTDQDFSSSPTIFKMHVPGFLTQPFSDTVPAFGNLLRKRLVSINEVRRQSAQHDVWKLVFHKC